MDWNLLIKGAGALATAYAGIEANNIEKDKLKYAKSQDAANQIKEDKAQSNLDASLDNVYGVKKKKKTELDVDSAYGTPIPTV